jgi:hypothetical protein
MTERKFSVKSQDKLKVEIYNSAIRRLNYRTADNPPIHLTLFFAMQVMCETFVSTSNRLSFRHFLVKNKHTLPAWRKIRSDELEGCPLFGSLNVGLHYYKFQLSIYPVISQKTSSLENANHNAYVNHGIDLHDETESGYKSSNPQNEDEIFNFGTREIYKITDMSTRN